MKAWMKEYGSTAFIIVSWVLSAEIWRVLLILLAELIRGRLPL